MIKRKFYGLLKEYDEGRTSGQNFRSGVTWMSAKMRKAIAWLKRHVESYGDRMPHEDRICLPSCQSKNELHNLYKNDCLASKTEFISKSAFKEMWRQHFKKIIIPKQNKFTKCGVCTLIKHSLRSTRDEQQRMEIQDKRQRHLQQQCAERNHYYGNRLKAELEPNKYLSLIVDGMDQAKTNLPHVTTISKAEESHYLKSHVTGAISHGHRRVFSFVDLLQWKHDTNFTLNVLLRIFQSLTKDNRLPPYLLLQMDNCYRECKNKYIMAFASHLVEIKMFKEVHISYLMVGHAHEDVDQFFSRISVKLRNKDVMTLPELHNTIATSYKPTPESCDIDVMFDISGWLKPHIIKPLKNHVFPHSFKYYLGENGKAFLLYKNWADDETCENDDDPIQILTTNPTGLPQLLRPKLGGVRNEVDLEDLKLKVRSTARMSDIQRKWWESFIEEQRKQIDTWDSMTEGAKEQLALDNWLLPTIGKFREENEPLSEEAKRQQGELKRLEEKQYKFPKIIAGKDKKANKKAKQKGSGRKRKDERETDTDKENTKPKKRGRPRKKKQ
ncbi:hypothetical protein AC249_AIPGENE5999 [Exaiptasia diaphana]|nr:hypothetical protein AC249_AIPGENE5999 [Exaiptasia diaphana]